MKEQHLSGDTYRITEIETQQHDENRVNIYLDGAFAFGLEKEVVIRHGLHEGDELTDAMIDDILLMEERTRAKEKALLYLSHRDLSIEEMRKKLALKRFPDRVIQRILDDLKRVGLLDDRKFALSYGNARLRARSMGKRILRQELLMKGLAEDVVNEAVEAVYADRSEEEMCRQIVESRLKKMKNVSRTSRKKIAGFLLRRGFDWDTIHTALPETLWDIET